MANHGRRTGGRLDVPASPLLKAKLRAPTVPDHYVRRERLLRLLDEAVSAPLTLVFAPAGVGKTVLLSGWAAETAAPTAWLSLDIADRDGAQFWSGVIAALETLMPGCGETALALLRCSGSHADVVGRLLDELEAKAGPPSVLIIDDVQFVDGDDDVVASLALFLQHLPTWLHIVLLSRREPYLPLDRLRARGQLGEVAFAELRFSRSEAREMLTRLAPSLSEDRVDATAERAEGWAAGLQLAALAARSAQAQEETEAPRAEGELLIEDYVWREVLAAEDEELVDALVDVAVVDRVNPSLARALTRRQDAESLLLRAAARGLFVTRRGADGWFELHSLVRPVLVAELRRRSPDRLADQHVRAARWFQDMDEVPAALEHWLHAGRPRDALRLLAATNGELYDSGREATIHRTIAAIPTEMATADLDSMLDFAWCHVLVSRRRFIELVEQVEWWAARSALNDTTRARLTTLQSIAATMKGDWVEGGALARRAMHDLGDAWWRDPIGRFGWNMIAREVSLSERWDDADDEVREAAHLLTRDPQRRLALEGTRALGEALAGKPADALRIAAGVRHAAQVSDMTILRAELAAAEGVAHRELGDRDRALSELEALADAPAETMLYCRILATLELAEARLDEGDVDAARDAWRRAESLIEAESFGPGGRGWLARVGTRLALAAADMGEARRWAELIDDPFWGGISVARVHLAAGNRRDAEAALATVAPRCVRHEVLLALLRAQLAADHDAAMEYATTAVELGTANGMLQTLASEGGEVMELIEHAAWRAPAQWLDRLRRAAAEGGRRSNAGRADLVEPLTERERDVLRFLPSRLTIREIADELYVSVNTLKSHLKAIYRKLGVSSRAEAAEAARRLSNVRRTA